MADGINWDEAPAALEAPGVEIRRVDHGDLAMALIRLAQGVDTRPLFAGMPNDQCQCEHWGYIISGTMLVRDNDGERTYDAGDAYYWAPATTWKPSRTPNTSNTHRLPTTTSSWPTATTK